MIQKKRELSIPDKIALCGVAILGKDYVTEAYKMSHKIKTENPASLNVMVSRWLNSDKAKDFLDSVRRGYVPKLVDRDNKEHEELTDQQLAAIIQQGILLEKDPKKQSELSLKFMEWRKKSQNDVEEPDRRTYFIPWVSHCRSCKLMEVYKKAQELAEKQP